LDGNRRVIADPGGIQWTLQVQRLDGSWFNRSHFRAKEALLRCRGHDPHPALAALPDRIQERVPVPEIAPAA
jgi:hypothetical protein